jgi:exonuclease III
LKDSDFVQIKNSASPWTCHRCTLPQFSDDLFDDINETSMDSDDEEYIIPNFKKGLKIALLNINGLLPNLDQLSVVLKGLGINVLCVNETKLTELIGLDDVKIPGYNMVRLDRTKQSSDKQSGGGVAIYIESHITYNPRKDLENKKLELTWLEVCLPHTKPILIGSIYRPPDSTTAFFAELQITLDKVSSEDKHVYLLGDLNANMFTNNPLKNNLFEVTEEQQLTQIITDSTRVTDHSNTCIDLIFTSDPSKTIQSGVIQMGISDHFMPYCVHKSTLPKRKPKSLYVRNYKRYDPTAFTEYVEKLPWLTMEAFDDPQDMLDIFVKMFCDAADKFAPMMHKQVKGIDTPWLCGEIRKLMTERDITKAKATKQKDIIIKTALFEQYKHIRNEITARCRKAKKEYFSNILAEGMGDPNKLWKSLKKVLPSSSSESPTMLQDEDGTHTEPPNIAKSFNTFFSNIGSTLAAKFPSGLRIQNPYPDFKETFQFKPISVEFTTKQLAHLQTSKSTGLDNLNARLLKDAANGVAVPLTQIMNASLKKGTVPSSWKKARVTPIFKADSPLSPSNYRPISILPVCMKIFERAVQ